MYMIEHQSAKNDETLLRIVQEKLGVIGRKFLKEANRLRPRLGVGMGGRLASMAMSGLCPHSLIVQMQLQSGTEEVRQGQKVINEMITCLYKPNGDHT